MKSTLPVRQFALSEFGDSDNGATSLAVHFGC